MKPEVQSFFDQDTGTWTHLVQAAAQAQAHATYRRCPGCQQPLACTETNERIVAARAGDAAWAEPEGYCDRCRRSFFPSVQEPRH